MTQGAVNRAKIDASDVVGPVKRRWRKRVVARLDKAARTCRIACDPAMLREIWAWLIEEMGYTFATLIVQGEPETELSLTYILYRSGVPPWLSLELTPGPPTLSTPSVVDLPLGPAVDWHERETEDLFGVHFEGHPRLGDFVLHETWAEGVNPMRPSFDARQPHAPGAPAAEWTPPTAFVAPGSFAMPVGPVFSDFAESAHFLLETVGEDVVRTIPRFFYKYRGVEKIAEGQPVERVLLIAERFSGNSAFAHGLAFCQAVETICATKVPPRAQALRTVFAEIERLRHHTATITGICHSTALVVATSQAALIEEELLRLSCEIARHRYFFGAVTPGGLSLDVAEDACRQLVDSIRAVTARLDELHRMLRYSSSFLDRLEEVGIVPTQVARSYGLVGPIARACGVAGDMRRLDPYAAYQATSFSVPTELEGDGYARLRVFFHEAEQAAAIISQIAANLPQGEVRVPKVTWQAGTALAAVEAPSGAAFHWVRLDEGGIVRRYRLTPPAFTNFHGFHRAAENFAFQDFPIILASFGLSNAECDR